MQLLDNKNFINLGEPYMEKSQTKVLYYYTNFSPISPCIKHFICQIGSSFNMRYWITFKSFSQLLMIVRFIF